MVKTLLIVIAIVIFLVEIIYHFGPTPILKIKTKNLLLPENLDQYLQVQEAAVVSITPGTEKQIVWAEEVGKKTPLAIVYLHGFSATHMDLDPIIRNCASKLGANLFLTRLSAHGVPAEAFASVQANDWLNDAEEAYQIGKRLGEEVIVIGMSTGGTLAAILSHQKPDIYASILLSPNFYPVDKMARFLTRPWGKQMAQIFIGKNHGWEPDNEMHERYWTCKYPVSALIQMMLLVDHLRLLDLNKIKVPIEFLFAKKDEVVDVEIMRQKFTEIGSDLKELIEIKKADRHVLAGDIINPAANQQVEDEILSFIGRVQK